MEGCRIVSIENRFTGEKFVDADLIKDIPAMEMHHISKECYRVDGRSEEINYRKLSDNTIEIMVSAWDADASIRITADEETGDILLEPSLYSIMTGVMSLRFIISGIRRDLQLAAPFQQGVMLPMDNELLKDTYAEWPYNWEAGIVVLQGRNSGFSVQAWDSHFKPKSLQLGYQDDPFCVGFDSCAYGPLDKNQTIGGFSWRISVHEGSWKVPAARYREWMWKAYNLKRVVDGQAEWMNQIRLAVSWCPLNRHFLDAIAKKVHPSKVLLHVPDWRVHKYDQDYPTFIASPEGAEFINYARGMGYHVLPHCNAYQISPDHPLFFKAINFSAKHVRTRRLMGWGIIPDGHAYKNIGPANGYTSILNNKDTNILVNIHPGFSPWRNELVYQIRRMSEELKLDGVFIDVTHIIYNADNSIVENLTYPEGALKLIHEVRSVKSGFAVGGEARNEINAQFLSFSQLHLFKYAHNDHMRHKSVDWLLNAAIPFSQFLFEGLSRGIGYYYGVNGHEEGTRIMVEVSERVGAIPTIIINRSDRTADAADIINNPDSIIRGILERASS